MKVALKKMILWNENTIQTLQTFFAKIEMSSFITILQ